VKKGRHLGAEALAASDAWPLSNKKGSSSAYGGVMITGNIPDSAGALGHGN